MPDSTLDRARPPRRTQAERSRRTRAKILAVTLDCMLERGLKDTSTVEVAERAGVSRGALLHHFPSKEALLKEALAQLLNHEIDEIRALTAAIDAGELDIDGFLARLWQKFSGPLFMITLEFVTAARTDPAIKGALQPVATAFNNSLDEIWERFFHPAGSGDDPAGRRRALTATLCFLRGLGTQSVWRDDPAFFADILAYWRRVIMPCALGQAETERRNG